MGCDQPSGVILFRLMSLYCRVGRGSDGGRRSLYPVSQIWMIDTMEKAIQIARDQSLTIPRLIFIYMDDCWVLMNYGRPGLRSTSADDPAAKFNECLNAVHPRVQFTREEEEEKSIAFLDVFCTRENNGTISTRIYRKPSNTNLTIKPQSCQHPSTAISNFKSELCRASRICSSNEQIEKEKQFAINLFSDNGHDREKLVKIAQTYTPPTLTNNTTNKKDKKKVQKKMAQTMMKTRKISLTSFLSAVFPLQMRNTNHLYARLTFLAPPSLE